MKVKLLSTSKPEMTSCNYIAIDNPNIPIICPSKAPDKPFGQFIDTQCCEGGDNFNPGVVFAKTYDMYLPNFSIRSFEGKFRQDALFYNQHNSGTDLLGSCLFLKGNIKSVLPGSADVIESYNMSQNFKFDPHNELRHTCPAETDLHFIHFSFTASYFSQFLPEDEHWAESLKTRISKNERILGSRFIDISLAQQQALKNIFDCPLNGKLGYLMIETSIVQIILLQMHSLFHQPETCTKTIKITRGDLDVIQELKQYLSETFLDDHSMMALAKQFGTNTNKLMSLFKKLFGKSIFEYIAELRMDHAKQLLRDQGLMVTEVARTVGYKNPNHFSSAFKKRYGINPSDFR